MDSFGHHFIISDYGETYSKTMGGTIEGCPAGVPINFEFIREEMLRRRPNSDPFSTQRKEIDEVTFHSGIQNGITTGETISYSIPNMDIKINEAAQKVIKPSHASYTYKMRYGIEDNLGAGRASARQTACRVVAGAIAKLYLNTFGITFASHYEIPRLQHEIFDHTDSYGAIVHTTIVGVPAGIGDPIYNKLSARLGYAMLSINAAKGFSFGEGFNAANMKGSEYNDLQRNDFSFITNHDGGIQAGISNGEPIYFSVAFKPIPTIQQAQQTIDFNGNPALYVGNNRNDRSVAPRVVPVVEAMAAIVIADFMIGNAIRSNAE